MSLMSVELIQSVLVLAEVSEEISRQLDKWGVQNHPSRTWTSMKHLDVGTADFWKTVVDTAANDGSLDYLSIFMEEFTEALEEPTDSPEFRTELIQAAAVLVSWIGAIDRRNDAKATMQRQRQSWKAGDYPVPQWLVDQTDWILWVDWNKDVIMQSCTPEPKTFLVKGGREIVRDENGQWTFDGVRPEEIQEIGGDPK